MKKGARNVTAGKVTQKLSGHTRMGDSGGYNFVAAPVLAEITFYPRTEKRRWRKYWHIYADFRNERNADEEIVKIAPSTAAWISSIGWWQRRSITGAASSCSLGWARMYSVLDFADFRTHWRNILQFQIGYIQAVLCAVLLSGKAVYQLFPVAPSTEAKNIIRWVSNEFDHIAHE